MQDPRDAPGDNGSTPVQVWDLPTRLFHWILVLLVAAAFVTAKIGGISMENHERCGVAILVLVLFRFAWGLVGSQESRFSAFVRGPSAVWNYLPTLFSAQGRHYLGHNPLGGWSVIALLICLAIQATTGLFANDDILTEGPLFPLVTKALSDTLTGIHHNNSTVLMVLIAVHLAAIVFYLLFKKENLILPMISGSKRWHTDLKPHRTSSWIAVAIFIALAAVVCGGINAVG